MGQRAGGICWGLLELLQFLPVGGPLAAAIKAVNKLTAGFAGKEGGRLLRLDKYLGSFGKYCIQLQLDIDAATKQGSFGLVHTWSVKIPKIWGIKQLGWMNIKKPKRAPWLFKIGAALGEAGRPLIDWASGIDFEDLAADMVRAFGDLTAKAAAVLALITTPSKQQLCQPFYGSNHCGGCKTVVKRVALKARHISDLLFRHYITSHIQILFRHTHTHTQISIPAMRAAVL